MRVFTVLEKTFEKQESNSCMRSNWHCAFDPSLGRNLFLNIRTGHSSYEHPSRLSVASEDCSCVNENNEVDNKQHQNVPHPVASHLSFSCTPWLPRQHRRSQISSFDEDTGSFCSNGMYMWLKSRFSLNLHIIIITGMLNYWQCWGC